MLIILVLKIQGDLSTGTYFIARKSFCLQTDGDGESNITLIVPA